MWFIWLNDLETKSLSLKYGAFAVVVAFAIIGASLYINPLGIQPGLTGQLGQTKFVVMLTDPPNVPRGTTELNVTYSGISLHVNFVDGSSNWVTAQESGRVNLLSLVNITKTIAQVSLPTSSTVDMIQFTLSEAEAMINGVVYPVTVLSNQLLVSFRKTKLNGTQTGALIDLRPTLVQIKANNSTGGKVSYYVLVPSATAIVKTNMSSKSYIGDEDKLDRKDCDDLDEAYKHASRNVTITSATLSYTGNRTTLSVTLKNVGEKNATVFGLALQGDFNTTLSNQNRWRNNDDDDKRKDNDDHEWDNRDAISFRISGSSLVPVFDDEDSRWKGGSSRLILKPGQSVTLTFNGVIKLLPDRHSARSQVAIMPFEGGIYTIRVMGEGYQTYKVTASTD